MQPITDAIKAKYFKRVFEVVDGLWFMALEEADGFDRALEMDVRVWRIVPKIQARELRALLGITGGGADALAAALRAKFDMEGYTAEVTEQGGAVAVKIRACPWHEMMKKSRREHLAGRVGEMICGAEYPVWMREFGLEGEFVHGSLLCAGAECCSLDFTAK